MQPETTRPPAIKSTQSLIAELREAATDYASPDQRLLREAANRIEYLYNTYMSLEHD